jgi:hypothetical protein
MKSQDLRSIQSTLKERYRARPETACVTLRAEGQIGPEITCTVATGRALVEAGLHPATGGTGVQACSGNMLLEALAGCAGVTMAAVATALGIEIRDGSLPTPCENSRPVATFSLPLECLPGGFLRFDHNAE